MLFEYREQHDDQDDRYDQVTKVLCKSGGLATLDEFELQVTSCDQSEYLDYKDRYDRCANGF